MKVYISSGIRTRNLPNRTESLPSTLDYSEKNDLHDYREIYDFKKSDVW